jgi:hypothetical protein
MELAFDNARSADQALAALAEQLHAGRDRHELVVIGGAALMALGFVSGRRATSTSSRFGTQPRHSSARTRSPPR